MTATKVAGVAYISALKGLSFTLTQLFYKKINKNIECFALYFL